MSRSGTDAAADAALAAAAALLAAADGADPDAVRNHLHSAHPTALGGFDEHLEHLRTDAGKGRAAALQALHPVKGDAQAAARVMDAVLDVGGGAGMLAPAQASAAREVCETLNLSPTRFGL
ncbi:MAG TPA: hypothetical protein VEY95_16785 [Azospirillaceae bacterium]|nr:hypothetical protein [Azospirillaceae bacterium]